MEFALNGAIGTCGRHVVVRIFKRLRWLRILSTASTGRAWQPRPGWVNLDRASCLTASHDHVAKHDMNLAGNHPDSWWTLDS
jgi:hypothetical protein